MHLNGLNLSGQLVRSEGDNHTGFDDTSFDTTDDFVDILKGETEGLVGGTGWLL